MLECHHSCSGRLISYLSDTLSVLATVQDSPGNATGVLPLEEERLGFAVLEAEDLGVATDVELTLQSPRIVKLAIFDRKSFVDAQMCPCIRRIGCSNSCQWNSLLFRHVSFFALIPLRSKADLPNGKIIVPFQGKFSGPRRSRRTSSFWLCSGGGTICRVVWVGWMMAMRSTDFVEIWIRWAKNC